MLPTPALEDHRGHCRCRACKLSAELCICGRLPRVEMPLRIVVIQHPRERHSQSNTGSLVHRVFSNSELRDYTEVMRDAATDVTGPWEPSTDYHVLFPRQGARVVAPGVLDRSRQSGTGPGSRSPARRHALVVLDARWRQARRMSHRVPGLGRFPFLTLPEELPAPALNLRRPAGAGQVSTAEAVARCLELLGHVDAARKLRESLELLVSRALFLRGKISRREFEHIERQRKQRETTGADGTTILVGEK